jgi:predicted O-linked N-acetylglucosamine transferase (SPINDLY family)
LALAYHGRDDRALKAQFASLFAERLPADMPRTGRETPHIGFVVTEGNEGVFLRGMAGLLERLDRRQLRISIVCSAKAEVRFRAAIDTDIEFVPLGQRMLDTLEAIRSARFDLLYYWEIGTDCTNYFLPFFRLAPIQCTSWGWPVTSGIAEVDYFLSADVLEPPDADQHYTESLVRLQHLPNYYRPLDPGALPDVRSQAGISADRHLYFCGQNPRKLHPDLDLLLADILRHDSKGVIALVEASKPYLTAALQSRMSLQLADCYDRIVWLPRMAQRDYLAWMAAADCVLDTPHYSGGANSSYDALSVAAPVVTLAGAFHRGRYTAAAYALMRFDDLVAASPDAYVKLALAVAANRDFARHCRRQIADQRGCLFGNASSVSELQNWFLHAIAQVR